jgi:hypothetical protein
VAEFQQMDMWVGEKKIVLRRNGARVLGFWELARAQ